MADDIQPSDGPVPWYVDEPTEIPPQAREILEKYSKIPSQVIIPHILQTVSFLTLFAEFPFSSI